MSVIQLTPKASAGSEDRESVIRELERALAEARDGKIDTVILILSHPDGEWSDRTSSTSKFSAAIGRLEITKQEWVNKYLKERDA